MDNLNLLEGLNPEQQEAVEYCDGPSLIIAGAGSGKTRVLTTKVAYLIREKGYQPWSILALTFTNKAANEMKQRIADRLGIEVARNVWMGTFHSVFLRILRVEHERIGLSSNLTIYDEGDSKSLIKTIIKEMELDDKIYKPSSVLSRISHAKNQLITAEEYVASSTFAVIDQKDKMPKIGDIFLRYAERCRNAGAMDFDDILVHTYKLFADSPETLAKYAGRFRYVLVDEYQDTNFAQHQIVYQLTKEHRHVCVVGDDAQSIYSFRGANINNILTFNKLYQESKLFKLEQNYRSTQTIVNAANSLIAKNSNRIPKEVFSQNEVGDPIMLQETRSDVEESQVVVKRIKECKRADHCDFSDFAILYRTNAQSRSFEEALRKANIPYRVYGGLSFYQRKEIKDVIAYFRLAVNPDDEEAFKRVVNYPARGIGATTLGRIVEAANRERKSLWNIIENPLEYGVRITGKTANALQNFRSMVQEFQSMAQTQDADQVGDHIIKTSGIIRDIYRDKSPENLSRQQNVEELRNGMGVFIQTRVEEGNQNIFLSDYLSEVSLLSDVETDDDRFDDMVTLMTVHSSKGLEFKTVFVVGLEENLFPSQLAGSSPRGMEEERRLFYVAITRAEKRCFLTYATNRYRYGKMEFGNPSRFIRDIDPQYLRKGKSSFYKKNFTQDVELPWAPKRSYDNSWSSSSSPARPDDFGGAATRHNPSSPSFTPSPQPLSSRLRPMNDVLSKPATASKEMVNVKVGNHIQHERFGYGVVEKIEGRGDQTKISIFFENVGVKVLLLKFAKFKIIV